MSYDVLVIGGGPAGATAGAFLARGGARVAVVEKARFPRRKVCGEYVSAAAWPVLAELGVADILAARAAPAVTRVGFFAAGAMVDAPMPVPPASAGGRAVGREILDTVLLRAARDAGAKVLQPCAVTAVHRDGEGFDVVIDGEANVRAGTIVAANGSWERDPLGRRATHRRGDLLGFKARFRGASLAPGLMPLILFPGGYGGLVHSDGGEVSFSCCIRRDALARCRARYSAVAGEAVLQHAMASSRGVRRALEGATRAGPWLSAGPIHPGVRALAGGGIYRVGNAAGEAHPLVAEGIGMAIQSGYLLARALASHASRDDAARQYVRDWHAAFAARVRASQIFAALTVTPLASRASIAALARAPSILTWGARWSGKASALAALAP